MVTTLTLLRPERDDDYNRKITDTTLAFLWDIFASD